MVRASFASGSASSAKADLGSQTAHARQADGPFSHGGLQAAIQARVMSQSMPHVGQAKVYVPRLIGPSPPHDLGRHFVGRVVDLKKRKA